MNRSLPPALRLIAGLLWGLLPACLTAAPFDVCPIPRACSLAVPRPTAGPSSFEIPSSAFVVGPSTFGSLVAAAVPTDAPARPASPPVAERVRRLLRELGPWAPITFVALFVLACVACVPTVPLTVAAGGLWGVAWGLVWVWIGVLFGSAAGFLIGRHLARDWVLRRLERYPRLRAIEEAVSAEGWKIVVLARLAPGSPFFLLNYAFGLTRIGFWEHLGATALSVLPGSLLFVYLGSLGVMALEGRIRTVWDWALFGIGLLALAWGVRLVARRSRRILDAKLARNPTDPEA